MVLTVGATGCHRSLRSHALPIQWTDGMFSERRVCAPSVRPLVDIMLIVEDGRSVESAYAAQFVRLREWRAVLAGADRHDDNRPDS